MFPKKERMKTRWFKRVFRKGIVIHGSVLRAIIHPSLYGESIAVVISSKHVKQAVQRNKLRRKIYHLVRRQWPVLPSKKAVILLYKGGVTQYNPADIIQDLDIIHQHITKIS